MEDSNTGNTGVGQQQPQAGDTEALRSRLEEQRKIQAGLDRQLAALTKERDTLRSQLTEITGERDTLAQQLQEIQKATSSVTTELEQLRAQYEEATSTKDSLQAEVEGYEEQIQRLKVATEVAQQYPHILALISANALPSTESIEDFREALKGIGESIGQSVQQAATAAVAQVVSGSKPEQTPVREARPQNLWQAFLEAQARGDMEEADRLRDLWIQESLSS